MYSHNVFATGLTFNLEYLRQKPFPHLPPGSLSWLMCWWNLWGWDTNKFQMLLVCARECRRSVEVLQQLRLLQVTKSWVTFLDCEGPFSIPFLMLPSFTSPPFCSQVRILCTLSRQYGTQHVANNLSCTSGCFPPLWWVLTNSFIVRC